MARSALFGIFNELRLTFQTQGTYAADSDGNPVLQPGTPASIDCWLKADKDPAMVQAYNVGASITKMPLRGRCVDPLWIPSTVPAGSECPLTLKGSVGVFKLSPRTPALLQEVEDALGEVISGIWTRS